MACFILLYIFSLFMRFKVYAPAHQSKFLVCDHLLGD